MLQVVWVYVIPEVNLKKNREFLNVKKKEKSMLQNIWSINLIKISFFFSRDDLL